MNDLIDKLDERAALERNQKISLLAAERIRGWLWIQRNIVSQPDTKSRPHPKHLPGFGSFLAPPTYLTLYRDEDGNPTYIASPLGATKHAQFDYYVPDYDTPQADYAALRTVREHWEPVPQQDFSQILFWEIWPFRMLRTPRDRQAGLFPQAYYRPGDYTEAALMTLELLPRPHKPQPAMLQKSRDTTP